MFAAFFYSGTGSKVEKPPQGAIVAHRRIRRAAKKIKEERTTKNTKCTKRYERKNTDEHD